MNKKIWIAATVLMVVLICGPAYGQERHSGADEWEFIVIPYLFASGLDGDATIKGIEASVDFSFSDIWDNLDFGAMVHFEARKGRWGFFLDPAYMKLSSDADVGPLDAEIDTELALIELGALYRLGEWSFGSNGAQVLSLDILGGVRYWYLKGELDVEGTGPLGIDVEVDESRDWIDPMVGGRFQVDITEKMAFRAKGDIGGFDIGDSSDFAWNAMAGLGYQLSERTTLWLGYRIIGVDYDDGSGSDLFEFDVEFSGPVAGLAVRF